VIKVRIIHQKKCGYDQCLFGDEIGADSFARLAGGVFRSGPRPAGFPGGKRRGKGLGLFAEALPALQLSKIYYSKGIPFSARSPVLNFASPGAIRPTQNLTFRVGNEAGRPTGRNLSSLLVFILKSETPGAQLTLYLCAKNCLGERARRGRSFSRPRGKPRNH
jgi:hypothetical protein